MNVLKCMLKPAITPAAFFCTVELGRCTSGRLLFGSNGVDAHVVILFAGIMFRHAADGLNHILIIFYCHVAGTAVHIGSGLHPTVVCNNCHYDPLSQCVFE